MMAEVKRRRRKLKPVDEAIQFSLLQKDKSGLEGRFINDFKGRGVFEKGDFLLEYRGDLIDKEECERRQRIYHDALKVYIFEFRYNGKLLCIDAARDDGKR
ncbi:N-lysine methyltransferase KMT5A-B-like [Puntigrus tetrazona]|uniref:N-lysine methyltransferase KMT5A-B-like n=1 Tax=Puntigrus tetrazona TaxID=1606681 RepID=UPI001C89854F|nr:N-lysine methyltransferase KMT5A-B-like [Puntigrus tetrazona]XP_043076696.1 N-lysine methyltransferase KMT5A-B-like [Puntigrus tetrazona]XP_043076704.1 N-lysine methyltransferase KMT5A-B-like [Puntigrus tetrazona]